jgi:hypothetical protein
LKAQNESFGKLMQQYQQQAIALNNALLAVEAVSSISEIN